MRQDSRILPFYGIFLCFLRLFNLEKQNESIHLPTKYLAP